MGRLTQSILGRDRGDRGDREPGYGRHGGQKNENAHKSRQQPTSPRLSPT